MKLIRTIDCFSEKIQCVVTIGNFDGVHLGHQQLLHCLKQRSEALQLPSCLITFDPQPNEFFAKDQAPARLTKFREKIQLLKSFKLDYLVCLKFNEHLSKLTAEEFINKILVKKLGVKELIIGDDFRFGYKRQGDVELLRKFNFVTEVVPAYHLDNMRVSSSRIRTALAMGDLSLVQKLLGRSYCLTGHVAHGDKLGRKLGFPTANIHLNRKVVPVNGIFAVKIHNLTAAPLYGVANIGNRPAVGGGRTLLEVYIFDFDQSIYGRALEIELVKKLRDEQYYATLPQLQQQIALDAKMAKDFFKI